jgi:hypothetical protein
MARRAKIALASYLAAALASVTAMAAQGPGVSPGTAGTFERGLAMAIIVALLALPVAALARFWFGRGPLP